MSTEISLDNAPEVRKPNLEKGDKIIIEGDECTITKILPTGTGVLNTNMMSGGSCAITPTVRIYFMGAESEQDYVDAVPGNGVEVAFG